ncbi:hypothetical protein [Bacteriophage Phobos]|uniref:DUF7740 domain-containing protein n=1 Tax=Bacteriophage Phobos TaxID=2662138 RepID=A0A5Q2U754_9CAUD|nr:hypothetical protein JT319_gp41 [Bacteriophage Phobos]QGH45010.1 hypothetical protein [Bacteriophage Phobos]
MQLFNPSTLAQQVSAHVTLIRAAEQAGEEAIKNPWDLRTSLLAVALAHSIHGTKKAICETTFRCYKKMVDESRSVLLLILESKDPVRMVPLILQEMDI